MKSIIFLMCLFLATISIAQDEDQVSAMKEFKDGTYTTWKRATYGSKFIKDDTYNVSKEYDKEGNLKLVKVGSGTYKVSFISNSYNKIYTGTHFQKGEMMLVIMDGKLYTFSLNNDGTIYKIHNVIGKKGGNYDKAVTRLQKYSEHIEDVEKSREPELEAFTRKTNPEAFYKKVYSSSEGYKKVLGRANKYGFLNAENTEIIPTIYDEAFSNVNHGIVGVVKNGLHGYIDMSNNTVISIDHEWVGQINLGLIPAKKDQEVLFYDLSGKILYRGFDDSYFDKTLEKYCVKKGSDFGLMNETGQVNWLLKNTNYDKVFFVGSDYIVEKNEKQGLYNPEMKQEMVPCILDNVYDEIDGVRLIKYKNKYGYFKSEEGFITEVVYDLANDFSESKGEIYIGNQKGNVNNNGEITWENGRVTSGVLLPMPLALWRSTYDKSGVLYFKQLTKVYKHDKIGFVNEKGSLVIPLKYDPSSASFEKGLAMVEINNHFGYIDESGNVIIPIEFDKVYPPNYSENIIKVRSGQHYLFFDLKGNKLDSLVDVVTESKKLTSFYTYDQDSKREYGPLSTKSDKSMSFVFTLTPDGLRIYGGNDKGAYIKSNNNSFFKGIFWNSNFKIQDGGEVSENEFIIPVLNAWHKYKIVNGSHKKIAESEDKDEAKDEECVQMETLNDNWVIGVWCKEKTLSLKAWNTESGELLITKITDNLPFYKNLDQVKLSVDVNKGLAVATYQESNETGAFLGNVRNKVIAIDLNKVAQTKSLDILWNVILGTAADYDIQDAVIDRDKNVYVLSKYASEKNYLVISKFNKDGKTLNGNIWKKINPKLWTRNGGEYINPVDYDDFYFDIQQPYFLVINQETDQIYVIGRLNDMKFDYSYSGKTGKSSTRTPFVIGFDENTLQIQNFDFIETYKNGKLNNDDIYNIDYYVKLENIKLEFAKFNGSNLYIVENIYGSKNEGLLWNVYFGSGSSSNVSSNTTASAQSDPKPTNSNSTETTNNEYETSVNKVNVQVNPNGKGKNFVHIYWSENGNNKKKSLQAKSTSSIGSITEGTKLYYSTDNDSKKIFFYEVPTGKSNVTVKIE